MRRYKPMHLMVLSVVAWLILPAGPVSAQEDEAGSSDLAWFHGGWDIGYIDRELGLIPGRADIGPATGTDRYKAPITADIRLRHPETGRIYALSLSSHAVEGDTLVLNLSGKSPPSGYHMNEEAFKEAVGEASPLEIGAGDTVVATLEGESEDARIVADEAPSFLREVTVRLTVPAEGEPAPLTGTWSYELSSPRLMRQGRAGVYEEAENTASGNEEWLRPVPRITSVTDIDMPTRRELAEMHGEKRRRGENPIWTRPETAEELTAIQAEEPDAYARLWLRIEGVDLPVQPRRLVDVEFVDDKIVWTGEHRPNAENPDFLDIRVVLKKGIVAGVKNLTLNEADGQWHYDTEPAQVRYMRMVSAADESSNVPAGFEFVDELYLGEVFYVELEYHEEPSFAERTVGSREGDREVVRYEVAKLPDRPTVLRSERILIDAPPDRVDEAPEDGETGLSSPTEVFVPATAGSLLLTTELESTAPSKGKPIAVAQVLEHPPSLWEEALARAKRCREQGLGETEVANYLVAETLLYAVPALKLYKEIRWGSAEPDGPIRRTLTITLDDHAAAILLRDELVNALGQYADREKRSLGYGNGAPAGPTELDRLRRQAHREALAARTAELIGAARSFARYENAALLDLDVDLPKGATDLGATFTRLSNVLSRGMEQKWFAGDRERFFEYAMGAVAQARRELADRAYQSMGMATKPTDCEVVKILALIRNVSGPIAQRVAKKLMRPPTGDEPRVPRWVPDRAARAKVGSVYLLAQAIKAQEEYSSIDTDVAVTLATLPVAVVGGGLGAATQVSRSTAIASRAVQAANWALDLADAGFFVNDLQGYSKARDAVTFAEGLVGIAGTKPLEEARQEATDAAHGVILGGTILGGQVSLHGAGYGIRKIRELRASRADPSTPTGVTPGEAMPPGADIEKAERLLGRPLTGAEREAVERAHRVGRGELGRDGINPAGIDNYTDAQLRRKAKLLDEAGIGADATPASRRQDRRTLMEEGVVGDKVPGRRQNRSRSRYDPTEERRAAADAQREMHTDGEPFFDPEFGERRFTKKSELEERWRNGDLYEAVVKEKLLDNVAGEGIGRIENSYGDAPTFKSVVEGQWGDTRKGLDALGLDEGGDLYVIESKYSNDLFSGARLDDSPRPTYDNAVQLSPHWIRTTSEKMMNGKGGMERLRRLYNDPVAEDAALRKRFQRDIEDAIEKGRIMVIAPEGARKLIRHVDDYRAPFKEVVDDRGVPQLVPQLDELRHVYTIDISPQ